VSDSREQNEAEFRAFVRDHEATLSRMASLLTTDVGAAEDLVQTALTRTFARWGRLRDQNPGAYARQIVLNSHIDRWRRVRGRERLTDQVPESSSDDHSARIAERDALTRAMAELSVQERQVVVLRFFVDLSEGATAGELGIPVGTVKSVTHRAVRKLRASAHLIGTN
jgi:RNA polymerase sigma-70 factor (sigma-E family)